MKKLICNLCGMICIIGVLWIIISWIDVLNHNDPYFGNHKYNPYNVFVLMGDN